MQKTENEENKVALVLVQKIEDLRLASFFLLNTAIKKKKKKKPSIWLMIRKKSHGSKSPQRLRGPHTERVREP